MGEGKPVRSFIVNHNRDLNLKEENRREITIEIHDERRRNGSVLHRDLNSKLTDWAIFEVTIAIESRLRHAGFLA